MYATSVMRREHAEWIDRTIALGDGDDQPSPELFAQGAFWAYMRGDQRRADELLAASLDLLPRLDEPAAALALTFLDPGDDPRVPDPRRLLEETASKMDLDRDWWVLISLADTAPIEDPDAEPVAIARLVDAAERTRVPLLMVAAMLSRGHLALTREPHDARAALRFYEEGSVIARTAGDLVSEGDALRAVALASVALDPPTAAPACRNALIHCYELRYWEPRVWQICASSALVLASAGRSEPAGVLLGNLDAHRRPWGFEHELGYRARTHDLLRPEPQVDQWVARGAAMDRHQIVVYAIDELAALCVTTA
jgi:hypothetical protein